MEDYQDFVMVAGTDGAIKVSVKDVNKQTYVVTGPTVTWDWIMTNGTATGRIVKDESTITFANGLATIPYLASDNDCFAPGDYEHILYITDNGQKFPVCRGIVTIPEVAV